MEIENVITEISKRYGVTAEQVKADIKKAIQAGMNSQNPIVREQWRKISHGGKEPTVEEVIAFMAFEMKTKL